MHESLNSPQCWTVQPRKTLTIGRDPTCDITINDRRVSRFHATIYWQKNRCILEDMGSRNGLFVDGRRVKSNTRLLSGDQIQIAHCFTIKFNYTNEGAILRQLH
ncbi:FHA domain-containing protein [Chloroflexi bacterium TSY]|nr:FHA domain-containing protein [Chloroflexi bacterium TSY]